MDEILGLIGDGHGLGELDFIFDLHESLITIFTKSF